MTFSKTEEAAIRSEFRAVSIRLTKIKSNVLAHKDGWRVRKHGKAVVCGFFDGDEEVEKYQSKTLIGLRRNLRNKLLNCL